MKIDLTLGPDADAPGEARAALARIEGEMSPDLARDLRLVVSELVTNSVRHGPREPIRLALSVRSSRHVSGEVDDRGCGGVAPREREADETGGWGLQILDVLADRWGVRDGTSAVWFELTA